MSIAGMVPLSPTCDATAGTTIYWITRRDACRIIRSGINKVDPRTGAVLGTISFDMYFFSYTSNVRTWAHQVEVQEVARTPGMEGTTMTANARCAGQCVNPTTTFPWQPLGAGQEAEGWAYFDTPATASGAVASAETQWGFQFSIPGTTPNPSPFFYDEYNFYAPVVRCDNATPGRPGTGCVFSEYAPTITYSRTGPYPELARHIGDGQASGLPGAYPSSWLTRLLTGDDAKDNRTKACPAGFTRPSGKSCDEYPFASSNQGASTGGGSGRTFSHCSIPQLPTGVTGSTGYSSCMIDATQNSRGGSELGAMYGNNRVIANDRFRVRITP